VVLVGGCVVVGGGRVEVGGGVVDGEGGGDCVEVVHETVNVYWPLF